MKEKMKKLLSLQAKHKPQVYRDTFIHYVDILDELDELEETDDNSGLSSKDTLAYFVTVNPDTALPRWDFSTFVDKVERFVRRKFVSFYYYSFEQGGSTPETVGNHPHVHILIYLDKSNQQSQPKKVKRAIQTTFESFCDTKNNTFCNIKPISADKIEIKRRYIMGRKSKKEKIEKIEFDNHFRAALGLQPYYTNHPNHQDI